MRKISKGHVIQFNETIKKHLSDKELDAFFKVTSTINKMISDKSIFENMETESVKTN
jgi:hypothetical protein